MLRSWRLPALAALLNVCLGAGVAAAQNRRGAEAPPGTRVEGRGECGGVASADVDPTRCDGGFRSGGRSRKPEIDETSSSTLRHDSARHHHRTDRCLPRLKPAAPWSDFGPRVLGAEGQHPRHRRRRAPLPPLLLIKGAYSLDPDAPARSWSPS